LIRFHGLSPHAAAKSGHKRLRALVTIEFFQLDNPSRRNLIRERATIIVALFPALKSLAGRATKAEKSLALQIVNGFTAVSSAHTNCAQSFRQLFESNPAEAHEVFERAANLLVSKS
jgi:hypothetical protein